MAHLLIIDDEPGITAVLSTFFERNGGHTVSRAHSGIEGVERFHQDRPDLTLLDLRLPDISGFEVLQRIRTHDPVVIMITAHGEVELAVEAMKNGAENFLTKPVDLPHLAAVTDRALEKVRLKQLNSLLRLQGDGHAATPLLGRSVTMRELATQVELLASSEKTIGLILGESGTGKGRVARLIHTMSPRAKKAFVEVNCATLTAASLDSDLFGHERGAVSDTTDAKTGLFEVAHHGTVFLDEVGDLASDLQPKLLGILEGKSFRRLGGTQEITTDVRLLAAASKDLVNEVNTGRFREDLYYRLSVMPVYLPPLRARAREDLVELIASLIGELRLQLTDAPSTLSDDALDRMLKHSWPGNIRELRNTLERAMLMARGSEVVKPEHLPSEVRDAWGGGVNGYTPKTLLEVERTHIHRTLHAHNLNRTHAARELGISRATLIKKIKQFGLVFHAAT
ncbi:MAG TPA: sigma-54 dependent transcriptional regulator [Gemmatimonadaceae bacterium]|jgi:DNA-binding NtrC family response regulator|nr:sigma-54 dependent transcriptional regulator [Gemmatimonadaceae bacterium]